MGALPSKNAGGAAANGDAMDVDGGDAAQRKQRQLYVGNHAMGFRRDGMEVRGWGGWMMPAGGLVGHALDLPPGQQQQPEPARVCQGLACLLASQVAGELSCCALAPPPLPMQVVSPFLDGVLSDWEVVEGLWDHALK